jgi:septal ring factor EnvC (AmiA/AmiB activator)
MAGPSPAMTDREDRMKWIAAAICLLAFAPSIHAQDIRGMELCTAEKQMDRRTGCLQANIELLQQMLVKLTRETNEKLAAANRELAATKAEIATLKATMGKLEGDLKEMKMKPAAAEDKPADKKR